MAERLLSAARQHLASADLLADSDPFLAYAALHDAIRKSLAALLQVQGLRPTTAGGHLAPAAAEVVGAAAKALLNLSPFVV